MAPFRQWFNSLSNPNKRSRERQETPPLVAYFWDGGQPVAHPVKDISSTGFYLCTSEHWPLDTLITITLRRIYTDSDHRECSIIVLSKVVRYGEDGVGFAFIPVNANRSGQQSEVVRNTADRKALDRFLQLMREDAGYIHLGPALILLLIIALATLSSEAVLCLIGAPFPWAATHAAAAVQTSGRRKAAIPSTAKI